MDYDEFDYEKEDNLYDDKEQNSENEDGEFDELEDSKIDDDFEEYGNTFKDNERVGAGRLGEDVLMTQIDEFGEGRGLSKLQKIIEKISMTPEQIYKIILNNTITEYSIPSSIESKAIGLMSRIYNLKFKSPKLICFALYILKSDGQVDQVKFDEVYQKTQEDLEKYDLLRYCFYVKKLLNL